MLTLVARPTPLSHQVTRALELSISAGEFQPGQRLPTEKQLGGRFAVSRPVVREAIARLKSDGYVETRQGAGAFVAARPGLRSFKLAVEEPVTRPSRHPGAARGGRGRRRRRRPVSLLHRAGDPEPVPLPLRRVPRQPVLRDEASGLGPRPRYRLGLAKVERLATGFRWSEGPVWFGDGRYLLWSDIPNNRIMRWDEETGG